MRKAIYVPEKKEYLFDEVCEILEADSISSGIIMALEFVIKQRNISRVNINDFKMERIMADLKIIIRHEMQARGLDPDNYNIESILTPLNDK